MSPFTDAPEGALRGARPFASVEAAWFWTMAALVARRDGKNHDRTPEKGARPCEPDDVVKCLDRLYRQRRIDLAHIRVLRIWGERQTVPTAKHRGDLRLWREVIHRLRWPLQQRDLIVPPTGGLLQANTESLVADRAFAPEFPTRHTVTTAATTGCG